MDVDIKSGTINHVKDVQVEHVKGVEVEHVKDVEIEHVRHISPVAVHLKEINNIDPVSVDAFNVTEVRNIEPLRVQEFNVTNLPRVNVSLRQLPTVELNVRRLPPVSVGLHQNFQIPSNYLLRMQLLGFEFFRVALNGQSQLIPCEKHRREQARTHERSFPEPATAGNPAIPSQCREVGAPRGIGLGDVSGGAAAPTAGTGSLRYGGRPSPFSLNSQPQVPVAEANSPELKG
jgi:hypothetical protein